MVYLEPQFKTEQPNAGTREFRSRIKRPAGSAPVIVEARLKLNRLKLLVESRDARHHAEVLSLIGGIQDDLRSLTAHKRKPRFTDPNDEHPEHEDEGHHDHDGHHSNHDVAWHAEDMGQHTTRLQHESNGAFGGSHAEALEKQLAADELARS